MEFQKIIRKSFNFFKKLAAENVKLRFISFNILGPSNWLRTWPICRGSRQSPIDIVTDNTEYDSSLAVPIFKNYDRKYSATSLEIKNYGHGVVVTPKYGPHDAKAEISYGGMCTKVCSR